MTTETDTTALLGRLTAGDITPKAAARQIYQLMEAAPAPGPRPLRTPSEVMADDDTGMDHPYGWASSAFWSGKIPEKLWTQFNTEFMRLVENQNG